MVPQSNLFNEMNCHLFTSQCVRLADFTTKLGSVVKTKQTIVAVGVWWTPERRRVNIRHRVSFETSFVSKQPKLEPNLVSALSETKRLFRLFRF